MALVAKPAQAVHSLPLNDEPEDEGPLIAPFGDVAAASEAGLRDYIAAFVMEFFRRPPDLFAAQFDIFEMELEYYSRISGTPVDSTTYGRLFIDPYRPDTSGLSDRGLTVFLLGECLAEALGVGPEKGNYLHLPIEGTTLPVHRYIDIWIDILRESGIIG